MSLAADSGTSPLNALFMTRSLSRFEQSPVVWVRWGGFAYLTVIALGLFGELAVRGTLVVPGDGLATLRQIAEQPTLWRLGMGGDLLMHLLDLPLILLFWLLLRPVSPGLALLATGFNLVQTAVLATNKLTLVAVALLSDDLASATATEPLGRLASLAIDLHGYGFGIGLLFFGVASILRGVLIVRSGFLPRVLGWGLTAAGVCYLINTAALLLAPPLAAALFPAILLPAFVGELSMGAWMLLRGIDITAWRQACRQD